MNPDGKDVGEGVSTRPEQPQGLIQHLRKWKDCGIEEKVERLRDELHGQRWRVNAAQDNAAFLQEHEHNAKGEIVVPLRSKRGGNAGESSRDLLQ